MFLIFFNNLVGTLLPQELGLDRGHHPQDIDTKE